MYCMSEDNTKHTFLTVRYFFPWCYQPYCYISSWLQVSVQSTLKYLFILFVSETSDWLGHFTTFLERRKQHTISLNFALLHKILLSHFATTGMRLQHCTINEGCEAEIASHIGNEIMMIVHYSTKTWWIVTQIQFYLSLFYVCVLEKEFSL